MKSLLILLKLLVWNFFPPDALLADDYPNDVGIETDPSVLFVEKFEGSLDEIFNRYTDIKNRQHISLETDLPTGGLTGRSIRLTNNQGTTDGAHLYKSFNRG